MRRAVPAKGDHGSIRMTAAKGQLLMINELGSLIVQVHRNGRCAVSLGNVARKIPDGRPHFGANDVPVIDDFGLVQQRYRFGRTDHSETAAAEKPLVKVAQRVIRNMPYSIYRRIGPSLGDLAIRLLG